MPRALTWQDLRGKVVLLDFWTYGCVNCMHLLPDFRALEERFRRELVIIGVHSPKFTNERNTENLRRILVRYEIEHPVVNDAEMRIWRAYGARAWPTRVIVDPAGQLVGTATGEGNLPGFMQAIDTVIRVFEEGGAINRNPLPRAAGARSSRRLAAAVPRQGAGGPASRSPLHQRLQPQSHRRRDEDRARWSTSSDLA